MIELYLTCLRYLAAGAAAAATVYLVGLFLVASLAEIAERVDLKLKQRAWAKEEARRKIEDAERLAKYEASLVTIDKVRWS